MLDRLKIVLELQDLSDDIDSAIALVLSIFRITRDAVTVYVRIHVYVDMYVYTIPPAPGYMVYS